VVLAACVAACGGVLGGARVGGESHFLRPCAQGCGTGLDCVAELCTRGCVIGKDACDDLARGATCTAASVEPGAVAVCDAACTLDADCSSLGDGFPVAAAFVARRRRPPAALRVTPARRPPDHRYRTAPPARRPK